MVRRLSDIDAGSAVNLSAPPVTPVIPDNARLLTYKDMKGRWGPAVPTINTLQKEIAAGRAAVTTELLHFLRNWLVQHIGVVDKKVGEFMRQHVR